MTMKRILLSALIFSTMGTQAMAAGHHKGGKHKKAHPMPTAEKLIAHTSMRQQRMQELFSVGEMSVSLMKLAHKQMDAALSKKDHSEVEKALTTFKTARHMHKKNMHMMQKMSKHLEEHLADVKAGKIALNEAQKGSFEKEVMLFLQQVKAFRADCQKNVKPKNQTMRKKAFDFLVMDFMSAKKSNQSDKMLHIAKIMKLLPPFKGEK